MDYQRLHKISKTTALYEGIRSVLSWDQETYMPCESIALRSAQFEQLADLIHQKKTSRSFVRALSKLIEIETGQLLNPNLTAAQAAAVREWRRDYLHAIKLPKSFVRQFAQVASTSTHVWKEAKQQNQFSLLLPHLKKIVSLCRKKADLLGYSAHPYDALVDQYEPEMQTATLETLFNRLKPALISLLKAIRSHAEPRSDFLYKHYAHDKQLEFGSRLLKAMGFEKGFSRLDESAHPMSIGEHPMDVRMTTRVYPHNPMPNIFSILHEGGHALYTHHLPIEEFGSPLCEPVSLGINESQSRFWETIIGRSLPFWQHYYPHLQKTFPEPLASIHLEEFYSAINLVKPTLIRTDSDEVTYNLHIMVRFELEKALIEGSLQPKDLPEAWNEKSSQYLSITPPSDAQGCLQDIHWAMGAIGYFPTYTLGNLYAAQFFKTFIAQYPNWDKQVLTGNLSDIRSWLAQQIHRFGRQYLPDRLCQNVTGRCLSEADFLLYLEQKYKALYHLV